MNEQHHKSGSKWSFDRWLLIVLLISQVMLTIWVIQTNRRAQQTSETNTTIPAQPGSIVYVTNITQHQSIKQPVQQNAPTGNRNPRKMISPNDIFAEMNRMFEESHARMMQMNRMFSFDEGWDALPMSPAMDMRETETTYEITLSIPDINPSNVELALEGRMLVITCYREINEKGGLSHKQFVSKLLLPGAAGDLHTAHTEFASGILRISIPKADNDETTTGALKLI